ncbi:MAG: response regulator transcription factor [Lachnospiraceae bacterium]|nr:response regulator transcription factor [Lachnospiraceae bacterium]MBR4781712.1 response regulator transcription factor [Lachnospiraceae bacterium]MBR6476435.1 response regulator transcription factor [Lachnospiraceae bacterium]
MSSIMIVDDDIHISDMLNEVLQINGYEVYRVYSGTEALLLLDKAKPDLILLDLMLPGLSGEELLPKIKDIPVIVVSAKAGVSDKVELLMSGAVDYITKPFEIDELLARIAVALRQKAARTSGSLNEKEIRYSNIYLYNDRHMVLIGNEEVKLTRTEYAILKILMLNKEHVVAKLMILDNISIDTPDCTEDSLKIHIHNLRKKIRDVLGKDIIKSVWGIGFMITDKS